MPRRSSKRRSRRSKKTSGLRKRRLTYRGNVDFRTHFTDVLTTTKPGPPYGKPFHWNDLHGMLTLETSTPKLKKGYITFNKQNQIFTGNTQKFVNDVVTWINSIGQQTIFSENVVPHHNTSIESFRTSTWKESVKKMKALLTILLNQGGYIEFDVVHIQVQGTITWMLNKKSQQPSPLKDFATFAGTVIDQWTQFYSTKIPALPWDSSSRHPFVLWNSRQCPPRREANVSLEEPAPPMGLPVEGQSAESRLYPYVPDIVPVGLEIQQL